MTVCIASISTDDKSIFAVSDHMLSTGDMSVDFGAIKFRPIHNNWIAMFSGNDVSTVVPVLRRVQMLISAYTVFPEVISRAFQTAIQEAITSREEVSILLPFGLTMEQFTRDGLRNPGQELD
jgi:hypothetical protein